MQALIFVLSSAWIDKASSVFGEELGILNVCMSRKFLLSPALQRVTPQGTVEFFKRNTYFCLVLSGEERKPLHAQIWRESANRLTTRLIYDATHRLWWR